MEKPETKNLPPSTDRLEEIARREEQLKLWESGDPKHNAIDDECCPDFSCCHPTLLADEVIRKAFMSAYSAPGEDHLIFMMGFLQQALEEMGHTVETSDGQN